MNSSMPLPDDGRRTRRRKAMPAYQRRRRRNNRRLSLTTADQLELENSVKGTLLLKLLDFLPILAWMMWLFSGTVFYTCHDRYDWAMGLYISVSIGWSLGWIPPYLAPLHENSMSKLYSSVHVCVGEMFLGVAVIYLAQELVCDRESWMISVMKTNGQIQETFLSQLKSSLFKFRILGVLLIWILFGIVFNACMVPSWGFLDACDYVVSTLSGSGYRPIPDDSPEWMFILSALYTFSGYPINVIALGLIVSSLLAGSHERSVYQKICDDVSNEEVEVMRVCGIGKDEDNITKEDFIVLMLVRIGAAPTQLILKLHDRFRTLDRKGEGRIAYDDIVYGRKKKPNKSELITRLFMRSFSAVNFANQMSMSPVLRKSNSDSSVVGRSSLKPSPSRVYPSTPDSFLDMTCLESGETSVFTPDGDEESLPVYPSGRHRGYTVSPKALVESRRGDRRARYEEKESDGPPHACHTDRPRSADRSRASFAPPLMQSPLQFSTGPSDLPSRWVVPVIDEGMDCEGGGSNSDVDSEAQCGPEGLVGVDINPGEEDSISESGPAPLSTKLSDHTLSSVGDNVQEWVHTQEENNLDNGDVDKGTVAIYQDVDKGKNEEEDKEQVSDMDSVDKKCLDNDMDNVVDIGADNGVDTKCVDNEEDNEEEEDEDGDQAMPMPMVVQVSANGRYLNDSGLGLDGSSGPRAPRLSKVVAYQLDMQKRQDLFSTIQIGNKKLLRTIKEYTYLILKDSHFILFSIWFTWLYGGALFYSLVGQISFSRGLYISVSVGYSIFWAEPVYTPVLKAYTILHLLFGSCMVACAMAAFARSIVESQKKWYVDALLRQAMTDAAQTEEIWDDVIAFLNYWYPKLKVPLLFVTWAALGIVWSCVYVEWSFIDGLYFVTSGLATGGMWPIPEDSPEWFFFFVGVYVSCGVPIMALAVGTVADIVANSRNEHMLEEKMNARVTDEELQLMVDCGIENGDGFIDMAEFVILILVRLRAVSPELIGVIEDRFVVLDSDKNGTLTHKELTVQRIDVIKRIQSNTSLRRILTNFD